MRSIITLFLSTILFGSVAGQSVTVSVSSDSRQNGASTFTMLGNTIDISEFSGALSYAVSANYRLAAAIKDNAVAISSSSGDLLAQNSLDETPASDPSFKVYLFENGGYVIRENISRFSFYDVTGRLLGAVNNSSSSNEGEVISELATDPSGKFAVVYNPKIILAGKNSSRASIVNFDFTVDNFFFSDSETIEQVVVSPVNGLIALRTSANEVHIFDSYGSAINTIKPSQEIINLNWSAGASHIVLSYSARVQVYDILSGEALASSSLRSPVHFAAFYPEDSLLLILTGERSGDSLAGVEVHAVDTKARKISRTQVQETLYIAPFGNISTIRSSKWSYSITGMNKILSVKTSF